MTEEQSQKIEKLIKEESKIIEEIKNKLKIEINKIDFRLTKEKLDEIYVIVEEDINNYLKKVIEQFKLETEKDFEKAECEINFENKKKIFDDILKVTFKELNIFVKITKESISKGYYILFKGNESILIAFLVENFNNNKSPIGIFETHIMREKLEKFVKIFKVKENFIEKLLEERVLEKLDNDVLHIYFRDSNFSLREVEENSRKVLLQSYSLEAIEKTANEIKKYNNLTKNIEKRINEFENSLNKSKIEGITILSIFVCVFSYLSINFSLSKELLLNETISQNIFLILAFFLVGLIPIVVIFLLIKFIFLMPKDYYLSDDSKKNSKEKYTPPIIIILIFISLEIGIAFIYKVFEGDYKKYTDNLKKEVFSRDKKIKDLEEKIFELNKEYEEQEKIILRQSRDKKQK